jgi:copper(I)-binding protein
MKHVLLSAFLLFAAAAVHAQVQVKDAWVRSTVSQQTATGAFMSLSAPADAMLVSASSPAAAVVEIHESFMEKDVLKMRAVPSVAIPAGKGVELKPGGYHVMLMNLKAPVKEGDTVPITLVVEGKDGKRQTLEVKAQARALTARSHGSMKH